MLSAYVHSEHTQKAWYGRLCCGLSWAIRGGEQSFQVERWRELPMRVAALVALQSPTFAAVGMPAAAAPVLAHPQ